MTIEEGARRYRHSRGHYTDDERNAADTALQRGRLTRRAAKGDKAARQALADWRESLGVPIHDDPLEVD